jgi:hypothetical protein
MLKPNGKKYELLYDLSYKKCVVPKGTTTDGITYKLRIAGLFFNKFDPRYIEAVIVHDYLTEQGDWDKANRYFEELLPNDFRSRLMVLGVKLYRKVRGY